MEDLNMKSAMLALAAMVLAAAVGCDNKPSTPAAPNDNKGGVEVNAPGVKVETGDKAEGGGVEVTTPGAEVDVNKKTDN
jgi:hypothetical protein